MFLRSIFKKNKKNHQEKISYQFNIDSWMNLSKQERLDIDTQEKNKSMKKKKALLKSIRDEYIKIRNKK